MGELKEIKENFKEDSFNGHWLSGYQIQWLIEQAEQVERYKKAVTLALMTLENNNLMNDEYRKIHSILDGE